MLDTSKTYKTKFNGSLKIIDYVDSTNITVEFIDTGYQTVTRADKIKIGNVKDYLMPNIYGVGFIGVGDYKSWKNSVHTKAYKVWTSMLQRCYSKETQAKQPTYKGCSVNVEWHNFQNFAEWLETNYIQDYDLDKDIIKHGNKIYSPEFCKFVPHHENAEKARAKHYGFISPKGVVTKIYNLTKFCRENNLSQGNMAMVHSRHRNHHKGWRLALKEQGE